MIRRRGITIKGEARHLEPGQSYSAGGEARFLGDTTFTTTWDLTKSAAKMDIDRAMKYPAVEALRVFGKHCLLESNAAAPNKVACSAEPHRRMAWN